MIRLCLCALVLCGLSGCASEQWQEFWKDARGDNMKMRSQFSETSGLTERTDPPARKSD